jgi:hypothetical protein
MLDAIDLGGFGVSSEKTSAAAANHSGGGMIRASKISLLAILMSLGVHSDRSTAADPNAAGGSNNDAQVIYESFLDEWTGKDHSPINVSKTADQPSPEDIKNFTDCAKEPGGKPVHWVVSTPIKDLGEVIRNLSYVHIVDPTTWHPDDPHDRIANGESVESAVDAGFAHGLLTFSAISFDESRTTAAFTYSFVCGRLCGNGGVVLFKKSSHGWTKSKRSCGGWVS